MKIAVLSGKGGTGKTFVSVNLAVAMGESTYLDCDVEEPNGQLFFRPEIKEERRVVEMMPAFDKDKCDGCRKCVDFCKFNALAFIAGRPFVFPEVCHPCGGCALVCPQDAVTSEEKEVGTVEIGKAGNVDFVAGKMNIGEASGVPIIKNILGNIPENPWIIVDCPPGSGCMAMESISQVDYCILVAEPTEFGRHNLEMVYNLVKMFDKPMSVVLNKCTEDENPSEKFCKENNIEIIGKLPFSRITGKEAAEGNIIYNIDNEMKAKFDGICDKIKEKLS